MGVVMGTAAYMSPEQARGKPVDKRTDIWAFGVVLYEMLTGKMAFQGEDLSLTLAAVMKENPNWEVLPQTPRPIKNGSSGKWGGAASQRQAMETAALCKPWKNK